MFSTLTMKPTTLVSAALLLARSVTAHCASSHPFLTIAKLNTYKSRRIFDPHRQWHRIPPLEVQPQPHLRFHTLESSHGLPRTSTYPLTRRPPEHKFNVRARRIPICGADRDCNCAGWNRSRVRDLEFNNQTVLESCK